MYGIGPTRSATGRPNCRARGQDFPALLDGAVVAQEHGDDRHAGLGFGDEPQVSLRLNPENVLLPR